MLIWSELFSCTPNTGPLALTVGFRLSLATASWKYSRVVGPVPLRDDDVALHALRPRRRLARILAGGDAIGPVGKRRDHTLPAEPVEVQHTCCRRRRCRTCRRLSHASTEESKTPRLFGISRVALLPIWWHGVHVLVLTLLIQWAWLLIASEMPLPFGPVPGNSFLSGMLEQRVPVVRRVVLGRGARVRRDDRRQVDGPARCALHLRRIDQAVAAGPRRCSSPSAGRAPGSDPGRR